MAIIIAKIESFLVANGFKVEGETKHYKELIHKASDESVYLNKAEPKVCSQLIVHPRHLARREQLLKTVDGVGSSAELRFGANLKKFPKQLRNGKKPCAYGVPFGFDSTASLGDFTEQLYG